MYRGLISLMPKALPLLLDLYPNASVAYSLRRLRTAYTGNCIRVRRSSDNTEQDIGFVGNDLDTTSLLSFVGTGNGFVVRWYDQSGNANTATQATVGRQPLIVSGGNLLLRNGKPYVRMFQGATISFMESSLNTPISTVDVSMFLATSYNIFGGSSTVFGLSSTSSNNQYLNTGMRFDNNLAGFFRNGTEYLITAFTATLDQVYLNSLHVISNTDRQLFVDNTNSYSNTTSSNSFNATYVLLNRLRRSAIEGGYPEMFEFVIYATSKTALRNGIENNINQHYGIY